MDEQLFHQQRHEPEKSPTWRDVQERAMYDPALALAVHRKDQLVRDRGMTHTEAQLEVLVACVLWLSREGEQLRSQYAAYIATERPPWMILE